MSDGLQLLILVVAVATPFLTAGFSFGAVKKGLNGAREDISEIKTTVGAMDSRLTTMDERAVKAALERTEIRGRLNLHQQRLDKIEEEC